MDWLITNDIIEKEVSFKKSNLESMKLAKATIKDLDKVLPETFQIKDDDDNIYFIGRSSESNTEEAFEPLDWAMANYGCTSIEYLVGGKWEIL